MDNKIQVEISNTSFPSAKIILEKGESCFIEAGAMISRTAGLELKAHLNAESSSMFGRLVKATARSIVSGENVFITKVTANESGYVMIAPKYPGKIATLDIGKTQYCLNDGAFLALDGACRYKMQRQTIGKALFSGTGSLFVMTTEGEGRVLINAFGDIHKIELNNETITIDNGHVVAWDSALNYNLHFETGFFQSMGTNEGLVNTFHGTGTIYIQTLNLQNFAQAILPYIPNRSS